MGLGVALRAYGSFIYAAAVAVATESEPYPSMPQKPKKEKRKQQKERPGCCHEVGCSPGFFVLELDIAPGRSRSTLLQLTSLRVASGLGFRVYLEFI